MDDELARIRDKRLQELKNTMRRTEPQASVEHVDETHFQEFVKTNKFAVIDFWAEWCGPCRMMAPTIDVVANDTAGKVKVGKVDVDSNGDTAQRYNIRGIPTLLLFKGGRVVEQRVGAVGKSDVQKMLDPHVAVVQA